MLFSPYLSSKLLAHCHLISWDGFSNLSLVKADESLDRNPCTFYYSVHFFSSLQALSHVWLFATPWTAARQASLCITNSRSLLKLMSIVSVMPSNHLILCLPFLLPPSVFPSIRVFPLSQLFVSGGQTIGFSASASVLPVNTQDWSPSGWTGWISLQS